MDDATVIKNTEFEAQKAVMRESPTEVGMSGRQSGIPGVAKKEAFAEQKTSEGATLETVKAQTAQAKCEFSLLESQLLALPSERDAALVAIQEATERQLGEIEIDQSAQLEQLHHELEELRGLPQRLQLELETLEAAQEQARCHCRQATYNSYVYDGTPDTKWEIPLLDPDPPWRIFPDLPDIKWHELQEDELRPWPCPAYPLDLNPLQLSESELKLASAKIELELQLEANAKLQKQLERTKQEADQEGGVCY